MENTVKKPALYVAGLIGLGGALCALVPFGELVVPGLFGYLWIAGGAAPFLLALIIASAGAWLLLGTNALYVIATIFLVALSLRIMLKKRAAYFDTAVLLTGILVLTHYASINLGDMLAGNKAFFSMQEAFREYGETAMGLFKAMEPMTGMPASEMESALRQTISMLPSIMPATLCALGAMGGILCLLICVKCCRNAHAPIKPMGRFSLWQLPKSFLGGMLFIAVAVICLSFMKFGAYDAMAYAAVTVALCAFAVQGLALTVFLLKAHKSRTPLPFILALSVFILFMGLPAFIFAGFIAFAMLGFLEQLMQVRRKLNNRRGSPGNPGQ